MNVNPPSARTLIRAAALLLLATGLAWAGVRPADAHVRVSADTSTAGSFSALTFRVPNESDTAGTTKISIQLPQDTPLLYVSTKPVPGWTARSVEEPLPQPVDVDGTTITKAVRTVTWTADQGTRIEPGQYQEFSISVGPLPAPGTLLLPATQTYSDGAVVQWDQPAPSSGAEPEHPAPAITVVAATSAAPAAATAPAAAPPAGTTDDGARGLAAIGLVFGVAGLVAAGVALRRRPTGSA